MVISRLCDQHALILPQLRSMLNAQPRGDKAMAKATKDAKATSNTCCKTIPDTLSHFKGKKRLDRACYYLDGYLAPHYPVPAIRLEVDICETWDKTVVIFDLDKNDIVYGVYEGDFN